MTSLAPDDLDKSPVSPYKSRYFDEKAGEDLDIVSQMSDTTVVPQEIQRDVEGGLGCWQMFRFFLKHSYRDVGRRKCHFCLALCSVFIVVLSTLVVNTVTSKGPIIFMQLAQQESGEIDCVYTPGSTRVDNSNYQQQDNWSMNYTQAVAVMNEYNVEHNFSPRYQMCPQGTQMNVTNSVGQELAPNNLLCLKFIDTAQEKEIGVGVSWPYEAMAPYECMIASDFQQEGVQVGDKIRIRIGWSNYWNNMRFQYNQAAEANGWETFEYFEQQESDLEQAAYTDFECTVTQMISKTYGKMPDQDSKRQILMEFSTYTQVLAESTTFNSTVYSATLQEQFTSWMLSVDGLSYQYASQIISNMPSPRYQTYENSNYQDIQDDVLGFLYPIANYLGFYNLGTDLSLLYQMQTYSYAVLFIGLIFNVLLLIFVVVSCLLIYSLLLISVEAKTFEIGVMRLVGLTKCGFIGMIITQAMMFVIPSVIFGFICAFPCIYLVYSVLFTEDLGFMPSIMPGWMATIQALAIGILIPLLSSIIPIKRALSKNLTDSLNTHRSKNSGVLITFTDNNSKNLVPYVLFGSISVIYGMCIYYFLPMGLLQQNLGIIMSIFFMILLGMMLGLTLFVTNLQGILEIVLVYVFFFWERESLRTLLRKNLATHKQRNYLTSIIYALTLGCIIFLNVTASLQIQSINSANILANSDLYLHSSRNINATLTDPVLMKYVDDIRDFGYKTSILNNYQNTDDATFKFSDRANLDTSTQHINAIQPSSLFDSNFDLFYQDENTALTVTEQLYAARGVQGVGTSKKNTDQMISDLSDYKQTLLMKNKNFGAYDAYYQKRVLWAYEHPPSFGDSHKHSAFVSIPILAQLAQTSMDSINYSYLFIRVHDSSDTDLIDKISKDLYRATGVTATETYKEAEQTESVKNIIDLVFMVAIAIMMFLCFFSLSASMTANLYDQSKEIGILRSMGVTKIRIKLLYFYEALILVFASSMLGILIGVFVGWTMKLQMDLFLDQVSSFYFPWKQMIEIFTLSLLCAFFSTFGPTTELTRRQISQIFRAT